MQRANDNVLVRRLLEQPDLRAYYFQMLEACASAADGWLEQEIVTRANLVRDAAYADTRKNNTNEDFDAEILFLRAFARNRPAVVLAEIAKLRSP